MPVRKRKDRRKSAIPEWDTEMDLDIGWISNRTDEEMRAAWEQFRDYMMALPRNAGSRPVAWWRFEKEQDPPSGPYEAEALFEMGEMDEAEIEAVRRNWSHMPAELRPRFLSVSQ